MPDRPVKAFLSRAHYSAELWAFTEHELSGDNARRCQRDGQFFYERLGGEPLRVTRGGGVPGATGQDQKAVQEFDNAMRALYRGRSQGQEIQGPVLVKAYDDPNNLAENEMDELATEWRWVKATHDGRFIGWYAAESDPRAFFSKFSRERVAEHVQKNLEGWGWTQQYDLITVRYDFPGLFINWRGDGAQAHARIKLKIKPPAVFRDLFVKQTVIGIGDVDQVYIQLIDVDQALPPIGAWTKTFCTNPEKDVPTYEQARSAFEMLRRQLEMRAINKGQMIFGWGQA